MLLLQLLVQASCYSNTYVQELFPTTSRASRFRNPFVVTLRYSSSSYSSTFAHAMSTYNHSRDKLQYRMATTHQPFLLLHPLRSRTRHKTHIIVILNRLIRIQYQPDPDNTFNMIFMRDIQLQYLATCSIINSLLWVSGGEGHTSESGTGHTVRHGSFILTVNGVCKQGGRTYY